MMKITERRLRSVVRNVLAEMLGIYKRPKEKKGFKWGKWSRDVGGGGGNFSDYYADSYADGMGEIDEMDESEEEKRQKDANYIDGVDESEEEKRQKDANYLDGTDD